MHLLGIIKSIFRHKKWSKTKSIEEHGWCFGIGKLLTSAELMVWGWRAHGVSSWRLMHTSLTVERCTHFSRSMSDHWSPHRHSLSANNAPHQSAESFNILLMEKQHQSQILPTTTTWENSAFSEGDLGAPLRASFAYSHFQFPTESYMYYLLIAEQENLGYKERWQQNFFCISA